MLVATIIFLRIILLNAAWVYKVLRGKITEKNIKSEIESAY